MSAPYATVVVSYPDQPDREGESLSGTLSSILWGARSVTLTIVPDARAGGQARGAALLAGLSADLQRDADRALASHTPWAGDLSVGGAA